MEKPNTVLILTHNNIALNKGCVVSVEAQDILTQVCIIDNGSTDGTREWASDNGYCLVSYDHNAGVSKAWNIGLRMLFEDFGREHVLVLNSDTIIPPWFYRTLLAQKSLFVSGITVNQMSQIEAPPADLSISPHPDFSAFLIHRAAWEIIGEFDERMKLYASDTDYHIRGHRAGVGMYSINLPFYHERSSTLRNADPIENAEISAQANRDREVFRSIYSCLPWEPAYAELFR